MSKSEAPYLMIGALRRVAKLHIEGLTIEQAMLLVANELQDGMKARDNRLTKAITFKDLMEGKFVGDDM